ncbi:MAG: orotate phosphoribosyltransferase [Prevotellaceae bacterium]|jgi:orotate phosphoribosyltransferase|nr:orotate phosphoribosyltransferase [Prevotellaceae bacterium]
MNSIEKMIAHQLLAIKAIQLNVENPFTWASGWRSPIYCDNRKTLSHPRIRKIIYESLAAIVRENFAAANLIAGVATGAIAHGVLVAEYLQKPFIYVRAAPKSHGLQNLIEGELPDGSKVAVIEDLISTGGSSLSAVNTLRKAGADVLGMAAIFTYDFDAARRNFEKSGCTLYTLCNYPALIAEAITRNYIAAADVDTLKRWRESPERWGTED